MESRARYIRPLAQIGGEVGGPDLDGTGGLSGEPLHGIRDRKSTRLNSSHSQISYAVFCLKKKNKQLASATIRHALSATILASRIYCPSANDNSRLTSYAPHVPAALTSIFNTLAYFSSML